MGEMLNEKKVRLASWILALENEGLLDQVEQALAAYADEKDLILWEAIKPIREHQTIEDMMREQNYKGVDQERLDQIAKEMDIQEPIDDLLKCLTP